MVSKQRQKLTKEDMQRGIVYSSQLVKKNGAKMYRHILTKNKSFVENENELVQVVKDDYDLFYRINLLENDKFFNEICKKNIIKN